ncbi:DUF202 domain-containing protein [Nocardioides hwasunensis]|uniref:DUF202 domain-containing protein n=1 Tax=Nocardioides hwasunensis TaxID=397258 RepID=A0ABR8MLD4_9ACTN|nr:DUF202 domain-containing protein [Nocardioides hwasunensis]MBD3915876.1 DUF202 domain-containing protein [Nocardioides hwasunensis]
MTGAPVGLEDQYERTLLAWRRTALSLVAVGLLVAHFSVVGTGQVALLVLLVGLGGVLGFVWLGRARLVAVTGLAMVAGLGLLGALALRGILLR